ncbi:MAG: hypothetical protein C4334_05635 [Pyrinomonas sp.]|uniref:hypothetical protein n=1 Tax=Pyrinomonas sp. TaxID=2080306 RepID=UPI00331BB212
MLVIEQRRIRVARLVHALIAKAFLDIIFIIALVASSSFQLFEPRFRGNVDEANAARVAGWVVNAAVPARRVEVQLYIDGRFIAHSVADLPRPDVVAAGRAKDAASGFEFKTPPLDAGLHEARVYVMHRSEDDARRTLQLLGKPLAFRVERRGIAAPKEAAANRDAR